jgi:hypothetical protein
MMNEVPLNVYVLLVTIRTASDNVEREYCAAMKIQSWFRGERVRAYLRYLHECATLIQKCYRGHLGRKLYRRRLKERLKEIHEEYYDTMAARIQKTWKGYYVRKYMFDYYAQKEYLAGLTLKNEQVLQELSEYREKMKEGEQSSLEEKEQLAFQEEAKKKHYMLSTETARGPYYPGNKTEPLPLEVEMRRVKPDLTSPRRQKSLSQQTSFNPRVRTHPLNLLPLSPDATSSIFHEVDAATWYTVSTRDFGKLGTGMGESAISWQFGRHLLDKPPDASQGTYDGYSGNTVQLPPVRPKVQGPFKYPEEVLRLKYKPLQPTLRVATDFKSVETARAELKAEEWRQRVIDEKFVPFSKEHHKYQPLLHTRSPYEKPHYGTKHFREEDITKNMSQKTFRTLVPRIPLFDQADIGYKTFRTLVPRIPLFDQADIGY